MVISDSGLTAAPVSARPPAKDKTKIDSMANATEFLMRFTVLSSSSATFLADKTRNQAFGRYAGPAQTKSSQLCQEYSP